MGGARSARVRRGRWDDGIVSRDTRSRKEAARSVRPAHGSYEGSLGEVAAAARAERDRRDRSGPEHTRTANRHRGRRGGIGARSTPRASRTVVGKHHIRARATSCWACCWDPPPERPTNDSAHSRSSPSSYSSRRGSSSGSNGGDSARDPRHGQKRPVLRASQSARSRRAVTTSSNEAAKSSAPLAPARADAVGVRHREKLRPSASLGWPLDSSRTFKRTRMHTFPNPGFGSGVI